jgi:hypothetical protein
MLLLMSNQEGPWQKISKNTDAMMSRLGEAKIRTFNASVEYYYHHYFKDLMARARMNVVWSQLNAERAAADNSID